MDAHAAIWEKCGSWTGSENPAAIFLRPGSLFIEHRKINIFDTIKKGNAAGRITAPGFFANYYNPIKRDHNSRKKSTAIVE